MRVYIDRGHKEWQEDAPCAEAYLQTWWEHERRGHWRKDSSYEDWLADFKEKGRNHQPAQGYGDRTWERDIERYGWFVDVSSLEAFVELLRLPSRCGWLVLLPSPDDPHCDIVMSDFGDC